MYANKMSMQPLNNEWLAKVCHNHLIFSPIEDLLSEEVWLQQHKKTEIKNTLTVPIQEALSLSSWAPDQETFCTKQL